MEKRGYYGMVGESMFLLSGEGSAVIVEDDGIRLVFTAKQAIYRSTRPVRVGIATRKAIVPRDWSCF